MDGLMDPRIERARGIVECEAKAIHQVAERIGIPAILGVTNAMQELCQGEIVTLDLRQGVVHRGARSHNPETIGSML
jgi:pyruvate kinase